VFRLKSRVEGSCIDPYDRRGGVGDRRLCFWFRCRDLRDNIEPAHDLTFFCFFMLVFLDMEDLLDGDCSVEAMGVSELISAGVDSSKNDDWSSFDEELVGLLCCGEPSWPKNAHFLDGNLGVEGLVGVVVVVNARSVSKGLDRCLRGLGRSKTGDIGRVPSSLAAAVLGRVSGEIGLRRWSLEDGLEAETIEDKLPDTE